MRLLYCVMTQTDRKIRVSVWCLAQQTSCFAAAEVRLDSQSEKSGRESESRGSFIYLIDFRTFVPTSPPSETFDAMELIAAPVKLLCSFHQHSPRFDEPREIHIVDLDID